MLHYHIIVHGDVQGVGFRYFVMQNAILFGVNGWVRNRSDGTVEIDAEGREINIVEFIKAVERGSRYSSVESVDMERLPNVENYRSFEIDYSE